MNKKQRMEALVKGVVPDCMPVFAPAKTHGVYCCGWRLPDITGPDHLDAEKSAQTAFGLLEKYDLDIVVGSYFDLYLGNLSDRGSIGNGDLYPCQERVFGIQRIVPEWYEAVVRQRRIFHIPITGKRTCRRSWNGGRIDLIEIRGVANIRNIEGEE